MKLIIGVFLFLLLMQGCAPGPNRLRRPLPLDGYVVSRVDSLGHESPAVHLTLPWRALVFEHDEGAYFCRVLATIVAERDGRRVGGGVADSTVAVPDYRATRSRREVELAVPVTIRGDGPVEMTATLEIARTSRRFRRVFSFHPQAGRTIPLYFTDFAWNLQRSEMGDAVLGDGRDSLIVDLSLGCRPDAVWPEDGVTLVAEVAPVDGREGASRAIFLDEHKLSGVWKHSFAWDASELPFGPLQLTISLSGGVGDEEEHIAFDPPRQLVNLSIRWRDDRAWRRHLSLLDGLLDGDWRGTLEDLPIADRADAWRRFWAAAGEAEGVSGGDLLHRHLNRIVEADRRFGVFGRGGASDRGRAWVRYGEPDRIETWGDDLSRQSQWEVWEYFQLRLRLVFLDPHGMGDYYLYERRSI